MSALFPEGLPPLRVYRNDTTDWVVAYTEDDAAEVMLRHYLGDFPKLSPDEFDMNFRVEPDDKILVVCDEGHYTKRGTPRRRRLRCSTWAKNHGRGFLCSTEY